METITKDAVEIPTRDASITDLSVAVDVVLDNPNATALSMEQREARRKQLMRTCFRMTSPRQWTVFGDDEKKTVYPMGGASDAIIRHIFACTWQEKSYALERDPHGDPVSCEFTATLYTASGARVETWTGFRDMGGFIKSKSDLISGAFENLKSKAVRDLLGLRGRSPEELKELGLDLAHVGTASFQNNKSGADDVPKFKFGKSKDKAFNDPSVSDRDLAWYLERSNESLADPAKEKYRKSEERQNKALRDEIERRKAPATGGPSLLEQFKIRIGEASTAVGLEAIAKELGGQPEAIRAGVRDFYARRHEELAHEREPGE